MMKRSIVFLFLVSLPLFAEGKNKSCPLDLESKSTHIDWEVEGPTALQKGQSLTRKRGGRFVVEMNGDKESDLQSWEYQCRFVSYIGAFQCVHNNNGIFDAFVMIKKRNVYEIYDYYYRGEPGEIVIKSELLGEFVCP